MTINIQQVLSLAGAAAIIYCAQNTLSTSQFGSLMPVAANGLATGIVAGTLLSQLPVRNGVEFAIMSVTALALTELAKAAYHSHFSNAACLTFIGFTYLGFCNSKPNFARGY